ncbi:hypothetical protein [Cryobacterium sp. Y50]|uniref:hypothetical protein n=1 Tax=Cryobacterium sp. Y50 TaxID=2048286 RepID=UPI000CE549EB|nr:hypothetical protein [Cryobacterium sp. Y50]
MFIFGETEYITLLVGAAKPYVGVPLWVSLASPSVAIVAAGIALWAARSAHSQRPDKGRARMFVVGTTAFAPVFTGWRLENEGNGVAVNPRVEFLDPLGMVSGGILKASVTGQLLPNSNFELALESNWPSGSHRHGDEYIWEGLVGTVYWRVPGGRRIRKAKVLVHLDRTKSEVSPRRSS